MHIINICVYPSIHALLCRCEKQPVVVDAVVLSPPDPLSW